MSLRERIPPWLILGTAAAAAVGLYVWRKGGVAQAAQAAGAAVVDTAGEVAAGTVGAVGQVVGLPTPMQTTRDEEVARWLIDNVGHMDASQWSSAGAYLAALWLPEGTGKPPPADSPAGREFAAYIEAAKWQSYTDAETDRLAGRYPAPAPAPYEPPKSWNWKLDPGKV